MGVTEGSRADTDSALAVGVETSGAICWSVCLTIFYNKYNLQINLDISKGKTWTSGTCSWLHAQILDAVSSWSHSDGPMIDPWSNVHTRLDPTPGFCMRILEYERKASS